MKPEKLTPNCHANLTICMWNVGGMVCKSTNYKKIRDPWFLSTISGNDIIALVETQVSPDEPLKLEGYHTYRRDRPKSKNGRHFGGWAVLIKENLWNLGIKVIEQSLDFVWLKVSKDTFRLPNDLYLCLTYIPPCDSQYLANLGVDILEQIQNSIIKYSKLGEIILMGDLNARTGHEVDFVQGDCDTALPLGLEYITDRQISVRNSLDTILNTRGKEILDLCISARMRILNGRKLGDTLGYHTCHKFNGSSVADYAIVSESLLDCIPYFKVSNFMADISDHCCISFKIKSPVIHVNTVKDTVLPFPTSFKWSNESVEFYLEALSSPTIKKGISDFLQAPFELDQSGINSAIDQITNIYQMAAKKSLRKKIKTRRNHKGMQQQQPWYNKTLKQQRISLKAKANLLTKFPKDPILRGTYFVFLKLYRKNCKKQSRLHRQELINKLSCLHASNPKAYWDLVKKLKGEETNNVSKISPKEWLDHFKSLGKRENFKTPTALTHTPTQLCELENIKNFTELDYRITKHEITKGINELKNGKASGPDGICNELLKHSTHAMLDSLTKTFNLVLTSGVYPDSWAKGFITPIHKKEDPLLPDNYRGITITSCIGKLFNSILNCRLIDFLNKRNILRPEQIGFRAKCRTSDHIFVIKALCDKYKKRDKKEVYMCFIDLQKAFDSISHPCLLFKLLEMNMNGHVYEIIKSMYSKIVLQVNVGTGLTEEFTSNVGVRQGDNLSPTLFNLFINDIPTIFGSACKPVTLNETTLNCLLYADDLVLLSESAEGLQTCLDELHIYCEKWGLTVNLQKSKALIMNSSKNCHLNLKFGENRVEIVKEATYLGVVLDSTGSFKTCMRSLYNKGLKAIFKLKKVISPLPSIDTCLHLFHHMVKPILLYACEIWAFALFGTRNHKLINCDNLETIYNGQKPYIEKALTKYSKILLGVNRNTDNLATYGELGIYPLYIDAIDRVMKYWNTIENRGENPLLQDAYKCIQELHRNGQDTWLTFTTNIKKMTVPLKNDSQLNNSEIRMLKSKLKKQFELFWQNSIMNDKKSKSEHGRKLRTYREFKHWFGRETYLDIIRNTKWRISLTRFRVSAHRLMIERGRHTQTALEHRICPKCTLKAIEDERHFLCVCPFYNTERDKLMQVVKYKSPLFEQLCQVDQFCWLMSHCDEDIMLAVAEYVHRSMELRFPPL